jgi:hypothetical protein
MLVSFGLNLSADKTGAIVVIATALLALVTAVTARPVAVSVLAGIGTSVVTACAAFGLGFNPAKLGTLVAFLTVVMGLLLRQHLSPAPALKASAAGK